MMTKRLVIIDRDRLDGTAWLGYVLPIKHTQEAVDLSDSESDTADGEIWEADIPAGVLRRLKVDDEGRAQQNWELPEADEINAEMVRPFLTRKVEAAELV